MATIGLVMLIACANVTNLLLVRGEACQKELSVRGARRQPRADRREPPRRKRAARSARRARAGLAYAGVRVLLAIGPPNLPRLSEIAVDARTLAFAASQSLLSSVLFGLIPAVKYTAPRIAARWEAWAARRA